MNVCDTKVMYDSEIEADIAAAHSNSEMESYECGDKYKHWHLTHKKKEERLGHGRGAKYGKCRYCKRIMKRVNLPRHNCSARKIS